jgi:putative ABC transport system substrate-binding protein
MAAGGACAAASGACDRIFERKDARGLGRSSREFRRGLAKTGFVDGRNVASEYRWLEGMIGFKKWPPIWFGAVIAIPSTTGSALAAKAATETNPIVFNIENDPVAMGLVATLSRPGKNVTGVAMLQTA